MFVYENKREKAKRKTVTTLTQECLVSKSSNFHTVIMIIFLNSNVLKFVFNLTFSSLLLHHSLTEND